MNEGNRRMPTTNNENTNARPTYSLNSMSNNASQLVLMTSEGSVWNFNSEKYQKVLSFFDVGVQMSVVKDSLTD